MNRSVIIIGAGIGGLSAACYARMNGFETKVFEMASTPGGVCTSWRRKGYVFDGSIHHLAGTREDTALYQMWKALGAFPAQTLFPDELVCVQDLHGNRLTIYYDTQRLATELKRFAPQDLQAIDEYLKLVKAFKKVDLLEIGFWKWNDWLKNIFPFFGLLNRGKTAMKDYAKQFKSPALQRFFPTVQYDWEDIPIMLHLNILSGSQNKRYGWYKGGSLAFSKAVANRVTELGGKIRYGAEVEKIVVKDHRAVGVRLKNGEEHYADAVISNVFAYTTILQFLDGKYMTHEQKIKYSQPAEDMKMGIQVSFGVNRDMSKEPHAMVLFMDQPFDITGIKHDRVSVDNYAFDPSMAPTGKSSIKVVYDTTYSYWKDLYANPTRYREEKERIAQITLAQLEKFFRGIKSQVEVIDVATPITTERYSGNGRSYGNDSDINLKEMMRSLTNKPLTLPGLQSFFLIGQTAGGAGIPGCAAMGRNAIKALCRKEHSRFVYE